MCQCEYIFSHRIESKLGGKLIRSRPIFLCKVGELCLKDDNQVLRFLQKNYKICDKNNTQNCLSLLFIFKFLNICNSGKDALYEHFQE